MKKKKSLGGGGSGVQLWMDLFDEEEENSLQELFLRRIFFFE